MIKSDDKRGVEMKEIVVLGLILILLVACSPQEALAGKAYNDLLYEQKQQYWMCIKECNAIGYTRQCALDCMAKAELYTAEKNWCQDPDGKDYFTKSSVTSNLYTELKEDSCVTLMNGKTYLFEGICQDNKYGQLQKNCAELGNYKCVNGACVVANHPPVLDQIEDQTITLGETVSFTLTASDPDGDKLIFSGKLPKDSSLNKETGAFSWMPTKAGTYTLIFRVNDGKLTDKKYVVIIVNENIKYYDDFSGNTLDLSKWTESEFNTGVTVSFSEEHYVDKEEKAYHIQQFTPTGGDKGVMLTSTKVFNAGETIEYNLNYVSGSGNHMAEIWLNGKRIDGCPNCWNQGLMAEIGYWNGDVPAGSSTGIYHVKLSFLESNVNLAIARPDGSIYGGSLTGIPYPITFAVAVQSGHDGAFHYDYDSFVAK